jgi:hypothetical protein
VQAASAEKVGDFWILTGYGAISATPQQQQRQSLFESVQDADPGMTWAFEDVQIVEDGRTIAAAILNGTCIGVSDGSFKDGFGTAAWVLEGSDSTGRIRGNATVPGADADQCSYRSEIAGLYAMVRMVQKVCEFHDIQEGTVELCCDGESPLRRCAKEQWITLATEQHFDMIEAIIAAMKQSTVRWKLRHIRGHQDETKGASELDRYERLNCEMDQEAKAYWKKMSGASRPRQWSVTGEPWQIWIGDRKICRNLVYELRQTATLQPTVKYWERKGRFGDGNAAWVDWDGCERAMKAVSVSRRHFITKQASGFCGVGKMMKRMGEWPHDKCPRCQEPETTEHVLKCPAPAAVQVWESSVQEFGRALKSVRTDPAIVSELCGRLLAWKKGQAHDGNQEDPLVQAAVEEQVQLGWRAMVEGIMSKKWAAAQQGYANKKGFRFSKGLWASKVIRWIWEIPWKQWEHRNEVLHGTSSSSPEMEEIDRRIREELQAGDRGFDANSKLLFQAHKTTIVTALPAVRKAWLRSVVLARKKAEDQHAAMRRLLRNWMQLPHAA